MAKRQRIEEPTDDIEEFYIEMREALQVDKHDLDNEWVKQPQNYHRISEASALAMSLRDEAKDAIRDLEAELDQIVRTRHEDDEKKPTETAIKNEIRTDKAMVKANERLAKLNRNVQLLSSLAESWRQRRYALDNLVTLHVSGYSMDTGSRPSRDRAHDGNRKAMQAERKRRERD